MRPISFYIDGAQGNHPNRDQCTGVMLPFIFVAGVQPRTRKIDDTPRRCPLCGLHQAYFRRVDHYLSLFFIPVWRVKKGTPFLACDRCEQNAEGIQTHAGGPAPRPRQTCGRCGREIDSEFRFCPHCGNKMQDK